MPTEQGTEESNTAITTGDAVSVSAYTTKPVGSSGDESPLDATEGTEDGDTAMGGREFVFAIQGT